MKHREDKYEGRETLEAMQEAKNYNAHLRCLIRTFALDTSAVLDFGAGIGDFSNSLELPPGSVTCIEPDKDAQQLLDSRGFETHNDLTHIQDSRFTYIFTLNVLEHIEDEAKALAELYRVLRPGGRIFLYVPAFNLLYSAMDAAVGHHRRYTMKTMTEVLMAAGFIIDNRSYADALGFFVLLAYKFINRQPDGVLTPASVRLYDRLIFPASRLVSPLLSRVVGKNLYVVAHKPAATD
jgi:SAM-dependent methyltransferase